MTAAGDFMDGVEDVGLRRFFAYQARFGTPSRAMAEAEFIEAYSAEPSSSEPCGKDSGCVVIRETLVCAA